MKMKPLHFQRDYIFLTEFVAQDKFTVVEN